MQSVEVGWGSVTVGLETLSWSMGMGSNAATAQLKGEHSGSLLRT